MFKSLKLFFLSGILLCQFLFASLVSGNIEVFFSRADNHHPDQKIISLINEAKEELNIAIYGLTKPDIVQAIVSANQRGVKVRVVADRVQAAGRSSLVDYLKKQNIPLKKNKHNGAMHHKVCVIDGKTVISGSFNWSNNATYNNDENMLVIYSPKMAREFNTEFERLWTVSN